MSRHENISGQTFGFWSVGKQVPRIKGSNNWRDYYEVKCICGTTGVRRGSALKTGRSKSCGCKKSKLRPYESLYHLFLRAAKRTFREVTISYEDFVQFAGKPFCFYCEVPVVFEAYGTRGARYSLDRKDNALGYTAENCVVCCTECNFGKGAHYTWEEWWVMAQALRRYRILLTSQPKLARM